MSLVADPLILTLDDVARLGRGACGFINRIYLHWTGGHYGHVYGEYHLSIDRDGTMYVPEDGAGDKALTILREHTWHRNTGAIGIAICGAYDAVARSSTDINFGPEPPTGCQVEYLAKAVGILCPALGLALSPRTVLTHCEAAFKDGYGPGSGDPETRWDFWQLPGLPFRKELYPGGEVLRGKAMGYMPGSPKRLQLFRDAACIVEQGEEVKEEWQLTKPLLNAA